MLQIKKFSEYLKEKFGESVYKISVDTDFTYPYKCIYCNNNSSFS